MDIQKIAETIKQKILENTAKGIDRFGQPFKPYSTNPFSMPYASAMKMGVKKQDINDKNKARIFNSKYKGKNWLWVTWLGGYKQYRGLIDKQTDPVNLNINGFMLSKLYAQSKIIQPLFIIDLSQYDSNITGKLEVEIPEFEVTIGFTDSEAEQLAQWNLLKEREFLGLTDEDVYEVLEKILNTD